MYDRGTTKAAVGTAFGVDRCPDAATKR